MPNYAKLSCWTNKGHVRVVVETPRGSCQKFKYDEENDVFKLSHVLPVGLEFPFEFGFIPETLGEDGDPLDVIVVMDGPTFAGCVVESRVIGVIEANQTEGERTFRNDRLVAVPKDSARHSSVIELSDLGERTVKEIEQFFEYYNKLRGRKFEILRRLGSKDAHSLLPSQPVRKV